MKIGLVSLGCPKNLVDSEVMLGLAQEAGHDITTDPTQADVLVVNTCAFIDSAKQESIDTILEMAQHKQAKPGRRLIVTGCLGERYREELQADLPEVDVVLGTGDVPRIVHAIEGGTAPAGGQRTSTAGCGTETSAGAAARGAVAAAPVALYRRKVDGHEGYMRPETPTRTSARHRPSPANATARLPTYLYDAQTPRVFTTPRHYAYVKVAEGCDYSCAFCIIPTLRGQYRSRPIESIVSEAHALAARGVKELLLVSQDTTFYGVDRRERGALPRLLRALEAVDGLEWIRLLYLYPTTITDDVLDAMAELRKVCKYIDLPLQHSAPEVLRRMRRPGNRASSEALLTRIRSRVPGVALRSTFIVGFPGETRAEFGDLCDFVRTVEFDHVGVFTYSHEEGTAAFTVLDDVPAREKTRRQRVLMELQRSIIDRRLRAAVGTTARVLVDGPSEEHELVLRGRLEGQAPEIDSQVYLTDCDPSAVRAGDLLDVEIVGARGYDLLARPLAAPFSV